MKKEPKKKITIDDLAIMVGRGFSEVNENMNKGFADANSRFEKIELRLDKVEIKLVQIDYRLTQVEENQLDLKLRIDVLNYAKVTDELRDRIIVLEKKTGVKSR